MKKILSALLSAILMLSICSLGVLNIPVKAAIIAEGEYGAGMETGSYTFEDNGMLTLTAGRSTPGAFWDADHFRFSKASVKKIVVNEGAKWVNSFNECLNLESIVLPKSASIGAGSFRGCTKLNNVSIPCHTIGEVAFRDCTGLESINIQNTVINIKESAFNGCSNLKSVEGLKNVQELGASAFEGCTNLESIGKLENLSELGASAFKGCANLKNVNLKDNFSLYVIGQSAFNGCTGLESINLQNVKYIRNLAFNDCAELKNIEGLEKVIEIEASAFEGCTSLENITTLNHVEIIGEAAFRGCTSIKNIVLPDSVTSIGGWAFSGCSSIKSVTIPRSVTNIANGWTTFEDCSSLESITYLNEIEVVDLPSGCPKLRTLNIPNSVLEIYGEFDNVSGFTIKFNGSKSDWSTIEQSPSLKKAILEKRVNVVCTNNTSDKTSSSQTNINPTPSSKPTGNEGTTSKPSSQNIESTPVQNTESQTESSILTENESEPTDNTSSQLDAQISENKGGVSVLAIVLIAVGAVILGAGASVGTLIVLKKKGKF